jgi:hypothetical protein
MKKLLRFLVITVFASALVPVLAFAARPAAAPTVSPTEPIGYDISWVQCGKKLPVGQAFGIVDVNGGRSTTTNGCLAAELAWASKSVGGSLQPRIQLYVNTANPGEVISQITTWPASNTDKTGFTTANPYGTCTGANDTACSWQYGWNRAVEDVIDRLAPAAQTAKIDQSAAGYVWWLDVETANTWQSGSAEALSRNAATLEGMTSYFTSKEAKVGLYSTSLQWNEIVGSSVGSGSNLNGLANWRPSGSSLANAKANCSATPLTTGGFISLTQYVQQNLDKDHSCI